MKFKPYDVKARSEEQFTTTLARESIKLLEAYDEHIKYEYLSTLISAILLDSLNKRPKNPCTKQELFEYTKSNFTAAKQYVCLCVANGFAKALHKYSGKMESYACQVTCVKPDTNSQVH